MPSCNYCGSRILFGGVNEGQLRFCNATCHQQGYLLTLANRIPEDIVTQQVKEVHQGQCPKCKGPGPVDVHTAYSVWSALVLTSWRNKPEVCCQSCGIKSKLMGMTSSLVLGWWGFPWGLIMTPVQISRNLGGLISSHDPMQPSAQLENMVKIHLASNLARANTGASPEAS